LTDAPGTTISTAPEHRQRPNIPTGTAVAAAISASASGAAVTHPEAAITAASAITTVIVFMPLPGAGTSNTAVATDTEQGQRTAVPTGAAITAECTLATVPAITREAPYREHPGVAATTAGPRLAAGPDGVSADTAIAAVAPKYPTITAPAAYRTHQPQRDSGITTATAVTEEAGRTAVTARRISLGLNAVAAGATVARYQSSVSAVAAGPVAGTRYALATVSTVPEPTGRPAGPTVEPVTTVSEESPATTGTYGDTGTRLGCVGESVAHDEAGIGMLGRSIAEENAQHRVDTRTGFHRCGRRTLTQPGSGHQRRSGRRCPRLR
jgi:hypothetical protein